MKYTFDKNELYNKIMSNISECVKNIIDETFTTYPWNKILNYILKIQQELLIVIEQDNEQYNNPPLEFLNSTNFDDKKYIVHSLTHANILSDKKYFENIKKSLQLVGLNYSKSFIKDDKEYLLFLPKNKIH